MKSVAIRKFTHKDITYVKGDIVRCTEDETIKLFGQGAVVIVPILPSDLKVMMTGILPLNNLKGILHDFVAAKDSYTDPLLINAKLFVVQINGDTAMEMVDHNSTTGTLTYEFEAGDNLLIILQ